MYAGRPSRRAWWKMCRGLWWAVSFDGFLDEGVWVGEGGFTGWGGGLVEGLVVDLFMVQC